MLRRDIAQLTGLFIESIVYGIYLVTFGLCLLALFRRPTRWRQFHEISFGFLFVALSLFCIGTINLALAFYRIFDIQQYGLNLDFSSEVYTGKPWITIVKMSTVNLQVLIADSALIYRCWQVYGKAFKIIIIPLLLWAGDLGLTLFVAWTQIHHFKSDEEKLYFLNTECTTFWVVTIVLNIYATGAIVLRIWRVDCHSRCPQIIEVETAPPWPKFHNKNKTRLQEILGIVIDSGLIQTACSIAVFCSQIPKSTFIYVTTSAYMMVIAIAFNLIVIRVSKASLRDEAIAALDPEAKALTAIQFNLNHLRSSLDEPSGRTTLQSRRFPSVHSRVSQS